MSEQLFFPRPEYPRPDFRRGMVEGHDWLNLNGPWQFRFDGRREGLEEEWFRPNSPDWREQILVPFCWESLAAWGEGDAAGNDNFYATRVFRNPLEVTRANHRSAPRFEVGWYRRLVSIPGTDPWQQKRILLHIGAADFFTDCWCNGVHVGHHEGGYTPFEFDLTDALKPGSGEALIVLRVEDPMDNAEQPVGKQWGWYTTTSGIWQTVFLEPRHPAHIRSFRIQTDIEAGTADFTIQCENVPEGSVVELEITGPGSVAQTAQIEVRRGLAEQEVKLASVALWDPNSPHLYSVEFRLRQAQRRLDTVQSYFGLRKVDFERASEAGAPASLRLNGVPRYLRGALYQSYFPDGVYTASSVETLKNDILWAKKFGFNFLRVHIKVDDPLLLYWADRLGILLMADFPNFGEGGDTALGRRRFETMMRETIERDFNHPSIFSWCLFNETWGFGGQTSFVDRLQSPAIGGQKAPSSEPARLDPPQVWVQKMWELAKRLDPSRLVEDMSVCHWEHLQYYQHGDTDINSWHFYIHDYDQARTHIEKVVRSTFIGSSFNYVPGFVHRGQPLINSEYGGIGALDGDRDVSWSFKFLTNELRRHQQIAAYIYTELHDVEWEFNGFLNYDRTPKQFGYDPKIINESNALPIDSPPAQRLAPGSVVRLEIASSHFSTRNYGDVELHWELGGVDDRGQFHGGLSRGREPIRFPHRQVAPAHTIELRLPEKRMACTALFSARSGGETIAQNFVHLFASDGYPPAREESPRTLVLRALPGDWTSSEWTLGGSAPEQARAADCCYGSGQGYFEWTLPLNGVDIASARRLKLVCEASSHRADSPQTDDQIYPTTLGLSLNGIPVYEAVIPNHPHDARGVLSYLRGGVGAYGYLAHAFAEDRLLSQIAEAGSKQELRVRCAVPAGALAQGGLNLYGAECGRFPLCPTVIIDW